jgi:hypothetical protein
MTIEPGASVWIPCKVVRGHFRDERNVQVGSPEGEWHGFVASSFLRDDIETGNTAVRATIVAVNDRSVSARLPGQTAHAGYFTCPATWLQEFAV